MASLRIVVLLQELSAVWTSLTIPEMSWLALHSLSSAATACCNNFTSAAQMVFPEVPLRAPSNVRPLSWLAQLLLPWEHGIVHTEVINVLGAKQEHVPHVPGVKVGQGGEVS